MDPDFFIGDPIEEDIFEGWGKQFDNEHYGHYLSKAGCDCEGCREAWEHRAEARFGC